MRNYPTVDRDYFQELLASAFAVQQLDSQSRSTLVEIGRSVTTGELDVDEAVHLIVDPIQAQENTRDVAIGQLNGAQLPFPTLSTVALKDEPSSAADSTDECVRPLEIASGRFQLRDPSTLLLILVIAVALSVGWLLTSPVYVDIAGAPQRNTEDAAYFVAWMGRLITAAQSSTTWNTETEQQAVLAIFQKSQTEIRKHCEATAVEDREAG